MREKEFNIRKRDGFEFFLPLGEIDKLKEKNCKRTICTNNRIYDLNIAYNYKLDCLVFNVSNCELEEKEN